MSEKTEGKEEKVPLPATMEEAHEKIKRVEHGAADIRSDEVVADNVAQHALEDRTCLLDELHPQLLQSDDCG